MSTITSRLIVALTDRASRPARGIGDALDSLHRRASRTSNTLLGGGGAFAGGAALRNLLAVGAGYVGVTRGIGGTVGAAIKFEDAFADVRKVVDGTPGELAQIRHEILSMSKTLPTTAEGIASIYAAAGQSNIPLRELGKFGEMVAKVSVAWETSEGETSDALAKIKNQLDLDVGGIGLVADAINELGNNTAAAAPDVVDYMKRVAATGKMLGFSNTQTLAFGSAMIASGAQSEVAATSFRNMGRALTIGERATKSHRIAFSKLGLDAVKTAKNMQEDALGTTLDVIDRIAGLPEWQRISIASALFGDEARALMPVISNSKELRRQIGLVARETDYAGSSFEEYLVRADTSGNALQILGNKIRGVGIGIGDSWLPSIKQLGLGIGDVLDTLNQRVGVLDQIKTSFDGFMAGVGYGGTAGLREMMNDLGDLMFGEAFDDKGRFGAVDERVTQLANLSNRFRGIGRDLRAFSEDIRAGDIGASLGHVGDALSKMSGGMTVTGALAIGLTGRALLALGAGAVALTFSKAGQVAIMAMAVATLINVVKEADSLGEFADNIQSLGALEWAAIGAGILMLVGPTTRLARATGKLGRAVGGWFGRGGKPQAPVPPGPGKAPTVAPASSKVPGTPGLLEKGARGFSSPFNPKSVPSGGGVGTRAPTGTPVSRPPVPSPMMELPSIAPAASGWGAALKSFFGKGGLVTTGLLAAGEFGIETGLDALNSKLQSPEQRVRSGALQDLSTVDVLRSLDSELARLFPSLRVPTQAATSPRQDTPAVDEAQRRVGELQETVTAATEGWPEAARAGVQGYVDAIASGGATAIQDASNIGAQIEDALSVTGHPAVDTGDLSRALNLARQLGMAVRNLGAAKVATPAVDGARAKGGPVRSGGTYLVGERGPELRTFSRSGFIHDATSTARMMRSAALASAALAFPAAAAPAAVGPDVPAVNAAERSMQRDSAAVPSISIASGAFSFTIHAAPGQSPEQIAAEVERVLSAKLNALSRGAFSDGAN